MTQLIAQSLRTPRRAPNVFSAPVITSDTTEEIPLEFTAAVWDNGPILDTEWRWRIGDRYIAGEDATPIHTDISVSVAIEERAENAFGWSNWASSDSVGPVVQGFDLYCDSVNGNDANAGTTLATAKRTIAGLGTITRSTRVGLARGSQWREQLGPGGATGPDYVTVAACGDPSLPMPTLRADDVVTTWTKTGGRTYVYQDTWTPLEQDGKNTVCVYENGDIMIRVADLATCDSTPGSFYVSSTYTLNSPSPIYIHATGNGNPASNGKVYEIPRRYWALRLGAYCKVRNIRTKRSLCNNGSAEFGRHVLAEDCIWEDGHVHNVLMASGTQRRCYAWKADPQLSLWPAGAGILFVHYDQGFDAGTVEYDECVALMQGVTNHSISGFFGHGQAAAPFSNVLFNRCIAAYCATGFASNQSEASQAIECLTYECGLGYNMYAQQPTLDLTRCEYYQTDINAWTYAAAIGNVNDAVQYPCTVTDCVFFVDGHGMRFAQGFIATLNRCLVVNATNTQAAYAFLALANLGGDMHLTVNNTLVEGYCARSDAYFLNDNGASGSTFAGSNNVYNTLGGAYGKYRLNGTTYASPAEWFAAGYESGSVKAIVSQFQNDPWDRDYTLRADSEAALRGVGPVGFEPLPFNYDAVVAWLASA